MKDSETRRLEMFIRVRQFGAGHPAAFPVGARGAELLAQIDGVINELEGHAAKQSAGTLASREGTTLRAVARAALREDLEAISRTARAMSLSTPGLDDRFRLPRNAGDQVLLAAARAFAQEAESLKVEFVRRGLPADFVEDLNADIEALEDAIDAGAQKSGARVAATVAIDDAIDRGTNAVRELDAVVRNVLRDEPAALAEWVSASHTERAPRRAPAAPTPAPPPPPSA
jgi:hypothetical protein